MEYARLSAEPRAAVAAVLAGEALGLAVETSGSTGAPREVLISADAIRASCAATDAALGGPGAWLLAIPATRIGGALVVARAALASTVLAELPPGPFTAPGFAAAALDLARTHPGRRYCSLVPTQVRRLLATPEGVEALCSFDAVLVGGAALGDVPSGLPLVSTYGATETCGGCVYDGVPLPGVEVAIDDEGRVLVAGPTLADGYADGDDGAFVWREGRRWFVTSDLGEWDGQLTVLGRADDVINTGGLKVHPVRVERALAALPGVEEAVVVGVPDAEWGEAVTALLVGGDPAVGRVREALAGAFAPHELPRFVVPVVSLPRTEGGKIDRSAALALARTSLGQEPS